MMTEAQVTQCLDEAAKRGSRLGLERVFELSRLLGEPQKELRVIHVSGTNGKGSFTAMLSAVLGCQGYRTGSFVTPALTGVKDSFLIGAKPISSEKFCELISIVWAAAETMEDKPTLFELLAVSAYVYFRNEHCDYAVIECCMGADLDATNIVDEPLLSVITNVALDHRAFLGSTTAEIAAHKAGVIKAKRPVVSGCTDEQALEVIKKRAKDLGSPLYISQPEKLKITSLALDGTVFEYKDSGRLRLSLPGAYQPMNAALVLEAVDVLRSEGVEISEKSVSDGLGGVRWSGRFEKLSDDPLTVYDGAHNPDAMIQAAKGIKTYFPSGVVALMGVMADKAYESYPQMLSSLLERVFTVTPDNPRALDARLLAEAFEKGGIAAEPCQSIEDGVRLASEYAKKKGLPLLIMGSLYLYKDVIKLYK